MTLASSKEEKLKKAEKGNSDVVPLKYSDAIKKSHQKKLEKLSAKKAAGIEPTPEPAPSKS